MIKVVFTRITNLLLHFISVLMYCDCCVFLYVFELKGSCWC